MPYFLYKVFPFHRLEKIAVFAAFPEASAQAKALRKDPALPADVHTITLSYTFF